MDAARISKALGIAHVEFRKEVTSTQDAARASQASPPYLVCALEQSAGKGRLGRRWRSDRGGGYFTLVVQRPKEDWAVPLVSAYALWKELCSKVLSLEMRWPNDLYVEGKKLAGVLVEGWGDRLGIGVGLNVNQLSFEGDLSSSAVSLRMLAGHEFDIEVLLISIVSGMLKAMDGLAEHGFRFFQPALRRVLLEADQPVKVLRANRICEGHLVDLGPSGEALVQSAEGELFTVPAQHLLEAT
ncbi:MAG: biotin--[acetyl-CoA-carboxylase] ligase [candidate division WOR-3 bacterium]|nr:biotin--[acetyl-CoA-carboxylase] ligase [candidate division WOR-3 bacterium]